ncbi:MAG: lipoyl synthase [Acidimicrobiales bacterium]|jgi:lipoic acid synthetase|nr:lipoyl synthase [Acidimicrobiales bacterium]
MTAPGGPPGAHDPIGRAPLRVRWLGSVPYGEAHALQHALFAGRDDWLLLLEHPHVYTLGARGRPENVLVDPADVGAELVRSDRGGDVTYHGPGQLVGYPIFTVPGKRGGGMADTVAYVCSVEQLVIDTLADLGLPGAGRLREYPGVWVDPGGPTPRKIAAIGVRLDRGRSMHGFALNVAPDMSMFGHIVPCGIPDKGVTSLAEEGVDVTMGDVVDALVARAVERWAPDGRRWERVGVVGARADDRDLSAFSRGRGAGAPVRTAADHRGEGAPGPAGEVADQGADRVAVEVAVDGPSRRLRGRLADAGVVGGLAVAERKPEWLRAPLRLDPAVIATERTVRDLGLVTVCEEAGCPNRSECWADGTATFMINGERCTRACGFCLVDTRKPAPLDPTEPERVAEAVERMALGFAVVTTVARDDLPDEGAGAMAATVHAIRRRTPHVQVEVLISDCRGRPEALDLIFASRPDIVNHNVETVPRLQRAVRPSAGYARSLAVLARARAAGLATKSGLVVGMGETDDEVEGTLADLAGVGVGIVTIGQYLRPTSHHLPVDRWVPPDRFDRYRAVGEALGLAHVESSPLTRSSYHARQAADAASAGV